MRVPAIALALLAATTFVVAGLLARLTVRTIKQYGRDPTDWVPWVLIWLMVLLGAAALAVSVTYWSAA